MLAPSVGAILLDPWASPPQYRAWAITATMEECMSWSKPRVVEVSLALEINSYACAEIG